MIFTDTGYYRGLFDKKDIHHKDSLKIKDFLEDFNETTVFNTTAVLETLNQSVKYNDDIKELYNELMTENIFISLTNDDYLNSMDINGWFGNSVNFNDCTIICTMMNLGINRIVSFDMDFEKLDNYEVISAV